MQNNEKKLSFLELIESLESRGVSFEKISKIEALEILQKKNYYYKISAYRKNFYKKDERYIQLDFVNLIDLASIDMQIRYFLLKISLDIEHAVKTDLLRLITENADEDGYSLVQEFKGSGYNFSYEKFIRQFKRSRYQRDMYEKRHNDIPVWTMIELMDFGSIVNFVRFYYKKYKDKRLKKMNNLCTSAKYIRNACAHSNVLMINFFGKANKLESYPSASVYDYARKMMIEKRHVRSKKVNDLISLFALEKEYASEGLLEHRKTEGKELLKRCLKREEDYKNNKNLKELYEIFSKLINYL